MLFVYVVHKISAGALYSCSAYICGGYINETDSDQDIFPSRTPAFAGTYRSMKNHTPSKNSAYMHTESLVEFRKLAKRFSISTITENSIKFKS